MSAATKRPRASLGVKKTYVVGVLRVAHAMYTAFMAATSTFASPPISMAAFLILVQSLEAAQEAATGTKAKGLAAARDFKLAALWSAMQSLLSYIQVLADALSADGAISLIQSAGVTVAGVGKRNKPLLAAALTASGSAVRVEANRAQLVGTANAAKHVVFNWQWSVNGTTWTSVPSTPYAYTEIAGLTTMTVYSFRVSVTIENVQGAWSQAVTLLVH